MNLSPNADGGTEPIISAQRYMLGTVRDISDDLERARRRNVCFETGMVYWEQVGLGVVLDMPTVFEERANAILAVVRRRHIRESLAIPRGRLKLFARKFHAGLNCRLTSD